MAKILIVDDSKTSRKILRRILEENGHEIIAEAINGEEGIDLYKQVHPELTTMDIIMPVMDGLEALRQIRDYDTKAKVIMVTASGQKAKIAEAITLGAAEFIAKPYEVTQIIKIVNHVLL